MCQLINCTHHFIEVVRSLILIGSSFISTQIYIVPGYISFWPLAQLEGKRSTETDNTSLMEISASYVHCHNTNALQTYQWPQMDSDTCSPARPPHPVHRYCPVDRHGARMPEGRSGRCRTPPSRRWSLWAETGWSDAPHNHWILQKNVI